MATKFYGDKPRSSYVLAAEAAARELDNYNEQSSREGNRRRMTPGNEYENPYAGLTNEDARNVELLSAKDFAQGTPEVAMTMGSSIAADVPAGYAGMMAAGDPNRNAVNTIESAQNKLTYQPRGEAGKRVMGYLGTAMEPIANWFREGTDAAVEAGTEAGLPPWMIAGPLAAAQAAVEIVPGPQKGGTKVGRFVRLAEEASAGLDADLLKVAGKNDPNIARAAQDMQAGMPMREADPSLVGRNPENMAAPTSDADVKALMDQPMGRRGGDVPANEDEVVKKHQSPNYLNNAP